MPRILCPFSMICDRAEISNRSTAGGHQIGSPSYKSMVRTFNQLSPRSVGKIVENIGWRFQQFPYHQISMLLPPPAIVIRKMIVVISMANDF